MKSSDRFGLLEKWIGFLTIFMVLLISNRFTWLCIYEVNMPLFGCWYGSRTNELIFYIIALLFVILGLLLNNNAREKYILFWKRNRWLVFFLLFCMLSLIWTIDWIRTIYKSFVVLLPVLIAVYLGVRYSIRGWLNILVVFGLVTISASYLLVFLLPDVAIMQTPMHFGSWRGAFSHRNYMGSIIAYVGTCILLMIFIRKRVLSRMLLAFFYIISWGLLFMSRSATGMILGVILNAQLLVYLAYLKWGYLLTRRHYLIIISAGVLLTLGLLLNIDLVFSLLGKNTSLTGRLPLWSYLFEQVSNHNLWLGYGLGTIWDYVQFRVNAANNLGWSVQIVNSHNGFMDVFVYLGVVGLLIFLGLTFQAIYRVIALVLRNTNKDAAWVLVTLVYVLVSNITISYFFDFETFHWVLFIAILAISSTTREENAAPTVKA